MGENMTSPTQLVIDYLRKWQIEGAHPGASSTELLSAVSKHTEAWRCSLPFDLLYYCVDWDQVATALKESP
jgi:hypothetical protein